MSRNVSAVIQDFQDLQAGARSLPPQEAARRAAALREELAAALPPLAGPQAAAGEKARQDAIRGLGQQADALSREAAGQRESARSSPHMARRAEETEARAAGIRRGLDAAAHVTDAAWWAKQAGANTGEHLAAAIAAHPQAKAAHGARANA